MIARHFISLDGVSRVFAPTLSLGDRLAATLGASVETRAVVAVDDVTLDVARGETLGLVGESGCGKSTLGRIAAGILAPSKGRVLLDGEAVMHDGKKTTTRIQTVFQDPFASLDPRLRVGDAVAEGPVAHGLMSRGESKARVGELLTRTGLEAHFAERYPHQFSGGQRQRIAIARALAMQPDALICDEPVASLDVSIQAQIINLFLELKRALGLTMVFISHDLAVVRHLADRVAIMYLGAIVESGPTARIYAAPRHPYTRALLDSVPRLDIGTTDAMSFTPIVGEIPSPLSPPSGCRFHPRCPMAEARCKTESPRPRTLDDGRRVACHLA